MTPVLSDQQMKDTAQKFKEIILENDGEIVNEELWGLKKLAYQIQHKKTGFYMLFEFKADPSFIAKLETEFRRDERIMRFLTVKLDKYAVAFSERRRRGDFNKKDESVNEEVTASN